MITGAEEFTLRARPPVRALAIAAGAGVVAIVLLGIALAGRASTALAVVAVVLLGLGLALGLGAVLLTRRLRADVRVEERAVTVRQGGRTGSLAWSDVGSVTVQGARLSVVGKAGPDLVVVNPREPDDPTFFALLRSIRQRLDADRGYGGDPFAADPPPEPDQRPSAG